MIGRPTGLLMIATLGAVTCAAPPVACQGTRAGNVRLTMRATPTSLPADGKSQARVRIEARDRNNAPVADDTLVLCHADTCLLSTSGTDWQESVTVTTRGGLATVYARSEVPGPATVTARVQDSRNEVVLQFLAEGEAASAGARVVHLRGGWVGFALELDLIVARDNARAQVGDLVFEATDGLEINTARQELRCWGVRISRGKERVEAEDCFFDIARRRGIYRYFGENGVVRQPFTPYNLQLSTAAWEVPADAFRADTREGMTWLVCKSCTYFAGQKIVLKHAALYSGDQKVFSFPPYWVVGLAGYEGTSNTQVVGVSSDGGVALEFPFFYRVTEKWSGSLKITRGTAGSSFVARDGWSLGVAEEYNTGDAKGVIEVGGLLRHDWGLAWRDERSVLGDGRLFLDVAWPDHRSVFADASFYYYGSNYRFNLRGQYDKPDQSGHNYGFTADWLTEPRRLTGKTTYRLGTSVGTRSLASEEHRWVLENELYAALDFPVWRPDRWTTLRTGVSNVYAWDSADYSYNALRGELRVDRQFGDRTALSVSYRATHRSGDTSTPGVSHFVGLDFNWSPGREWSTFLNGTWDATRGDTYGFASVNFFPRPGWRLGVMGTHYEADQTGYNNVEFEVGRELGNREVALRYSVDSGQFSLELGQLGLWR